MSGFKDMLNRDIGNVFLNADEFAEKCTVIYEGEAFRSIAVSLQENADSGRQNRTVQDHAQGLYRKSKILLCAAADLGGMHLEKDGSLEIIRIQDGVRFSEKFTVAASSCEMGMIRAELEAVEGP